MLRGVALLFLGGAMPAAGWAHSEGIEAADPATPAALLTLDSAASRYTASDRTPLQWRTLFESEGGTRAPAQPHAMDHGTGAHSGHAGAARHTSVTMQQ
jgi:hypothetical protein